jgi:CubicO group peptidase (beta-lactamase class C family)
MRKGWLVLLAFALASSTLASQQQRSNREQMIARARSLELATPYVPPPGDALEHHTAGFAQIMCSAVFMTGLDPEVAAESVGYFISPYAERGKVGKPVIDRAARSVHITLPNGVRRTARYLGDQGCVIMPGGGGELAFKPAVIRRAPISASESWPAGGRGPEAPAAGVDAAKVKQAVDAAFASPEGLTAAVVVAHRGRLIAERYADGITPETPLESWSMAKSLTSTLMGMLIHRGDYELWQPAPVPEWQAPNDPRAKIRIGDILQMSSGLRIRAPQDPDYDASGPYPDHLYLYTGPNAFQHAATRPQQWLPGQVGRYRNTDPVLVNYLIRLAVEKRKEEYATFPQRALFDPLGIRTITIQTDSQGNFLGQGLVLGSARDWARLGLLYLRDGVWKGKRMLPEGYVKFVSTVAPGWEADKRMIYGGFFWVNGEGTFPVPREAFYMSGAGGQTTLIVPSHDLVVVRLGHFKGASPGGAAFRKALALLMEALPSS